jgi:Formin Homology 2 Domain
MLGQAEKYMKVMTGFTSAAKRIQVMIYKQQFKSRVQECGVTLSVIENACDDVKKSVRLKKVLKTILKVGNQMNDGEKHLGFTLDSLLKLQSAKAFDKKTSILQYVIMLIHRNDEQCLRFPDDLAHCAEAARLTLDSAQQEQVALRQGLEASLRVIAEIKSEDAAKNVPSSTAAMAAFLVKARQTLDELDVKIESVRNKYANLLAYFGEEPTMASQEFFTTLTTFVQEFVVSRDNLERVRRLEAKKAAREKEMRERQSQAQSQAQPQAHLQRRTVSGF